MGANFGKNLLIISINNGLIIISVTRYCAFLWAHLSTERPMCNRIDAHLNKLFLNVSIPMILDLIICSSRQSCSDFGPPKANEKSQQKDKELSYYLISTFIILVRAEY